MSAQASAASPPILEPVQRRLRVVVVDEELPFPATSGKRIRTWNLVRRLAARHDLTYVCHRNADPVEARRAATALADAGIRTIVVDRAVPPKSGPLFYGRLLANLCLTEPYSVMIHDSRALRAKLRRLAEEPVDLWHCEWTPYAAPLAAARPHRWVVMAHNVESLIWQRYREAESNPLRRWYIGRQYAKFARFERRVFSAATSVIAVSQQDADLARAQFGATRISVVDNGVDVAAFAPPAGPRDPKRILCLGSLDWRPNQDGVRLLLDQIFPAVRAAEPEARLWIVGRNPPPWLEREAQRVAGVELVGNVPDVVPYLHQSGVLAVPLRIGGGSRLKIIEALATGLPVVSTRVGAEGLDFEPGRHLDVVPDERSMAAAIVGCLRDPRAAQAQAAAARQLVLARYDWDALADRLEQVWWECAACCV